MKKLALTSLAAMFAVSGANAANVIDGNPMYRPDKGHFYSETAFNTNTDFEHFGLGEEFGYGITENLSVFVNTSLSYDDNTGEEFGWDYLSLGLSLRYLDQGAWKGDLYGKVRQNYFTGKNFEDIQTVEYVWTAGAKLGYVTSDWTIAGKLDIDYTSDDVSAVDYDNWAMTLGLEGQYVLNSDWNIVAGLDYKFDVAGDDMIDEEPWNAKLGVNYNFDETKYLGFYLTKNLAEDFDEDPLGFVVKFGIDF